MVRGKAEADEPTQPPMPRQSLTSDDRVRNDEYPELTPMTLPPRVPLEEETKVKPGEEKKQREGDEKKQREGGTLRPTSTIYGNNREHQREIGNLREVPTSTIYGNTARNPQTIKDSKERQRESGTLREAPTSTIYGNIARNSKTSKDNKGRQRESGTRREVPTSSAIYGNSARNSRDVKDKEKVHNHSPEQLVANRTNENGARKNWLSRKAAAAAAFLSRENTWHSARNRWKANKSSSPQEPYLSENQAADARSRWRASKGNDAANTVDALDQVILQEPSTEEGVDSIPYRDEEVPAPVQNQAHGPEVLPTATPVHGQPVASEPRNRSDGGAPIAVATQAKRWVVFNTKKSRIALIGLIFFVGGAVISVVFAFKSDNETPPAVFVPEESASPTATPAPTRLVLEQIGQTIVNNEDPIESGPRGQRYFGWAVELSADGKRLVVAAPYHKKVQVYDFSAENGLWVQTGEIPVPSGFIDHIVLSDTGAVLAIGVPRRNSEEHEQAGMVQVYSEVSFGTWDPKGGPIFGKSKGDMIGGFRPPDGVYQRPGDFDDDFEYRDDESVPLSLDSYDSSSMALSEDGQILAVGSSRGNYVLVLIFDYTSSRWKDLGTTDFVGEARRDKFGTSVDLSADGHRIVIGAPDNLGKASIEWLVYTGHVRVYEYQEETDSWMKLGQDIEGDVGEGEDTLGKQGEQAGSGVSISADGTMIAVSSNYRGASEDIYTVGNNDGNVKVYRYAESRDEWIQIGNTVNIFQFGLELRDNDRGQYALISGLQSEKYPIVSRLSRDGKRLAVSVLAESLNGDLKGRGVVRLYELRGETWTTIGTPIEGTSDWDHSGRTISLSYNGSRVAIGAPRHNSKQPDDGQVRVFELEGTTTTPMPTPTTSAAPSVTSGPPVPLTLALDLDNHPEYLAWSLECGGVTIGNATEGSYGAMEFQRTNITQTFLIPEGSLCLLSVSSVQDLKSFRVYYGEGAPEDNPVIIDTSQMHLWEGLNSQPSFPFFVTAGTAAVFISIQLDGRRTETTISLFCDEVPFVEGYLLSKRPFALTNMAIMGITEGAKCVFTIEDSFGDGLCCGGYYKIHYGVSTGGNLLAAGGQFAARENVSFIVSPDEDPLTKPPTRPPTLSPGATISPTRSSWAQVGQVLAGKASFDRVGASISLSRDGSIMAVGTGQYNSIPGYVSVFRWKQDTQEWTAVGQELIGQAIGDAFGNSLSLNGNGTIVAVGAPGNDAGHVRVFQYIDGTDRWIQIGNDIHGKARFDRFGASVSLSDSGAILAVGAVHGEPDDGSNTGSVHLFRYNVGERVWNQLGQKLVGEATYDEFGASVFLSSSGAIVAIGAPDNDSGGLSNAGQVSVFQYDPPSSSWEPLGNSTNGQVKGGGFGSSVALDDSGMVMAVGGPGTFFGSRLPSQAGSHTGRVSVFVHDRATSEWTSRGQTLITQQSGDYFGLSVSLSSNGNVLAVGSPFRDANANTVNLLRETGQVTLYNYNTITRSWIQFGESLIGEAKSGAFGSSVSLSGDGTLIGVGAPHSDDNGANSGSVYVFQSPFIFDSGTAAPSKSPAPTTTQPTTFPTSTSAPSQLPFNKWSPLGQVLNGRASTDLFGVSIAVSRDGSIVAVGAEQSLGRRPGYVSVFRIDPDTEEWTIVGEDLVGRTSIDTFGVSVSLSGDGLTLAVGSDERNSGGRSAGFVQVYEFNKSIDNWVQLGNSIVGQTAGDRSGFAVSLSDSGAVLALGAFLESTDNGENSGSVRVFQHNRSTSSWTQLGQTLIGQAPDDQFGVSVSLSRSGTIVVIGAYGNDSGTNNAGQVSVYELNSSTLWEQLGGPINGQELDGWFGRSVSVDDSGLVVAVAAPGDFMDESLVGRVLVYAYDRTTKSWTKRGGTLMSQQRNDQFGSSVSLSGTGSVLAVGSRRYGDLGESNENVGQVAIFQYNMEKKQWLRAGNSIDGEERLDNFGSSVALSANGRVVGVGATGRDINGEDSGSVYMFTVNPVLPTPAPTRRLTAPPTITPAPTKIVPGEWKPLGQVFTGKASFDHAGDSISLSRDGSVMAVGAVQNPGPGYVSVSRFYRNTSSWMPMGQNLIGLSNGDGFGDSISLNDDGTILAVGARSNVHTGQNAGRVQVYEYDGVLDSWVQLGSDIDGQVSGDLFGFSISIAGAGDILAVGAVNDSTQNGLFSGSVRLFRLNRDTSSWQQLGQPLLGKVELDFFGTAVSLNRLGTVVGIGASGNDFGGTRTGQVLIYEYNSTASNWEPLGDPINGAIRWGEFGRSVSLSDDGVVIAAGAPGDPADKTRIGRVSVFKYDQASSTWTRRGQTIISQQRNDDFGALGTLSLSGTGTDVAIGSPLRHVNGENFFGQVEIFRYDADASEWFQVGEKLSGKTTPDTFGFAVSLVANGTVVGVGARWSNSNGNESSGYARVFSLD